MTTADYLTKLAKKRKIDDPKVLLDKLSNYEKDLAVECHGCKAEVGARCRDIAGKKVHFGRRLARLLAGVR